MKLKKNNNKKNKTDQPLGHTHHIGERQKVKINLTCTLSFRLARPVCLHEVGGI